MLISSEAWSPQEQECLGSKRDAKGPGEAQRQTAPGSRSGNANPPSPASSPGTGGRDTCVSSMTTSVYLGLIYHYYDIRLSSLYRAQSSPGARAYQPGCLQSDQGEGLSALLPWEVKSLDIDCGPCLGIAF